MKLTKLDIETLDRYLRNEMDAREKKTFEQRLKDEPTLKEAMAQLQLMQDGLRLEDLQQKKKMLQDWDDEIEEDKKTNLFGIGWKWSVAATVLLIVFAWLIWPQKGPVAPDLFASNFEPMEMEESGVRSGNEDPDVVKSDNFTRATNNYTLGHYDLAAPALIKVFEAEKDTVMLLYAGIAFLADGKADEALETFNRIDVWPEALTNDVIWYKALLYLEKQENEKAKKELGGLIKKRGIYFDKANAIIEKLD